MSWLKIAVVVIAIIAAGAFIRYGSAAPCDWLAHDISAKSGLPKIVVNGMLRIQFEGAEPSAGRCLTRWADLHINGLEPQFQRR